VTTERVNGRQDGRTWFNAMYLSMLICVIFSSQFLDGGCLLFCYLVLSIPIVLACFLLRRCELLMRSPSIAVILPIVTLVGLAPVLMHVLWPQVPREALWEWFKFVWHSFANSGK
jgi:hypothetical protein